MTVGDTEMYFNYDASGTPLSIVYNGTSYYYVTNLQGDVVGIVNQSGNQIVGYTYDAWGNVLTTTGSSANTIGKNNPLRYRGYVYDTETRLYYLQSRYYNPEWGRFINADAFAATGQGLLGNNMFAYCNNNPVRYIDLSGYRPRAIPFYQSFEDDDIDYVDLTEKLTEFMQTNATKLKEYYKENGYIKAALYFYENVVDGGVLDIKLQDEWKFKDGTSYYYKGVKLRKDDPGNINFGHVGAVLFSEEILCLGAGINQISKYGFRYGNITTYFDDFQDNKMIRWGYSLYWEDNA